MGYTFAWDLSTSFAGEQALAKARAELEVGLDALGHYPPEEADRVLIQKSVCDGESESRMEIKVS